MDEVLLNKIAIIERCINRVREEYQGSEEQLSTNYTKQDAIILNLQRTCEATIDLGTRFIKIKNLGLPQSSREVFALLEQNQIISAELSKKLQGMVGFRNIAIHDYSQINLDILKSIIENNLTDLLSFTRIILQSTDESLAK